MTSTDIDERRKAQALMLLCWRRRAIRASHGQYWAASFLGRCAIGFTSLNIVTAIAVLFFTNNKLFESTVAPASTVAVEISEKWQISDIAAFAGMLVVLTTALQYVLRLDEKSKDSKRAGNDFTNIKRSIENMLSSDNITEAKVAEIEALNSHISRNHFIVPRKIWEKAHAAAERYINSEDELEQLFRKMYGLPPSVDLNDDTRKNVDVGV